MNEILNQHKNTITTLEIAEMLGYEIKFERKHTKS